MRGCGWLNAVLGGQQSTNAEEEEDEGELEDEELFSLLVQQDSFEMEAHIVPSVNQMQPHSSYMGQIFPAPG